MNGLKDRAGFENRNIFKFFKITSIRNFCKNLKKLEISHFLNLMIKILKGKMFLTFSVTSERISCIDFVDSEK